MKRFGLVALCLFLVACGANNTKSKKVLCKGNLNYIMMKNEFQHKGDSITKISYYSESSIAELSKTEDEVETQMKQLRAQYERSGILYSYEIEHGVLRETTNIDLNKTKVKDLITLGLIPSLIQAGDDLSIEDMIEQQESFGLTCN